MGGGAGSQLRTRLREAFPCFAGKYSDIGESRIVSASLSSKFRRVISILPAQFPAKMNREAEMKQQRMGSQQSAKSKRAGGTMRVGKINPSPQGCAATEEADKLAGTPRHNARGVHPAGSVKRNVRTKVCRFMKLVAVGHKVRTIVDRCISGCPTDRPWHCCPYRAGYWIPPRLASSHS